MLVTAPHGLFQLFRRHVQIQQSVAFVIKLFNIRGYDGEVTLQKSKQLI